MRRSVVESEVQSSSCVCSLADQSEKTALYVAVSLMGGLLLAVAFSLCFVLRFRLRRRRRLRHRRRREEQTATMNKRLPRASTSTQTAESSTLVPTPSEHDFGLELLRFMHREEPVGAVQNDWTGGGEKRYLDCGGFYVEPKDSRSLLLKQRTQLESRSQNVCCSYDASQAEPSSFRRFNSFDEQRSRLATMFPDEQHSAAALGRSQPSSFLDVPQPPWPNNTKQNHAFLPSNALTTTSDRQTMHHQQHCHHQVDCMQRNPSKSDGISQSLQNSPRCNNDTREEYSSNFSNPYRHSICQ